MPLWFSALLGLVQGLTEFIPVSSTAHLLLLPTLTGRPDAGAAFTAVVQLGTLLAVLVYFARDLAGMARGLARPRSAEARLALQLALATVPIAVAGVLLEKHVTGPLRSPWVVAAALCGVALLMLLADRRPGARALAELGWGGAALIGVAQACALVPGVSRSGATLTAALLLGLRRDDAARFSFLLSIPAIAGAGVFELGDALSTHGAAELAAGTAVAFAAGYASIAWLMRWLRTRTLLPFVLYRLTLAAVLAALLAAGTIR